jgi:hypothetical protein
LWLPLNVQQAVRSFFPLPNQPVQGYLAESA